MLLLLLCAWMHSQLEGPMCVDYAQEPEVLDWDTIHFLKGGASHEHSEVNNLVESTIPKTFNIISSENTSYLSLYLVLLYNV